MNITFLLRRATLLLALALPSLCWALNDNLIIEPVPPIGGLNYTLTGPTGGLIGSASTNFTVTPDFALTGMITITPSGGGLSTPIVLTFSASASPQTFTITPTAVGPVTLTGTNNAGFADPPPLTYSTPPSAPTIGAATSGPGAGSVAVAFSAPGATGGSAITGYTATCNPGTIIGTGGTSPITVSGLTPGSAYTCTVTATNVRGVSVASGASNSVTASAASFTLTGPTGGAINSASTNFTVTPNGPYTGTITITPSGGGLSTPIILTFSGSAVAQTFTITPTAVGPVALTATNNGLLTNPGALSYATPPLAPTIGIATAGPGSASVAFTAPVNTGGATITLYTATCGAVTGTGASSPVTVSGLTSGTAYTCTVTATNSAGVSAASSASNQITIPATGFTFTGPTGGAINSVSGNFTVTPNAVYTGTFTVTPSGGGLSTPIVLTFTASAVAQTFTITPTAAGPVTLTPSNNGSLTNPAGLSYATPPSAPTIGAATAAGSTSASVAFTAPVNTGGAAITLYTATCNPGGVTGTGSTSPVTVSGLTAGTAYTCTVTATNSQGVGAASGASNQVTPQATTYTLTGPAGGLINGVSSVFTITPNTAFTGTITITVSGGGATAQTRRRPGSSPDSKAAIARSFTNSSAPQTFTVTPTSVGPVIVTTTNNAGLTDPAALSYATQPGAPTIVGVSPGGGSVVVSFTAPASGGSAITSYAVTCTGGATVTGASSPITVGGLTGSTTCTVTATNAFGVSAASNASNPVLPSLPSTPAPSTLVLLSIGGAGLLLWNRRRLQGA